MNLVEGKLRKQVSKPEDIVNQYGSPLECMLDKIA